MLHFDEGPASIPSILAVVVAVVVVVEDEDPAGVPVVVVRSEVEGAGDQLLP